MEKEKKKYRKKVQKIDVGDLSTKGISSPFSLSLSLSLSLFFLKKLFPLFFLLLPTGTKRERPVELRQCSSAQTTAVNVQPAANSARPAHACSCAAMARAAAAALQ